MSTGDAALAASAITVGCGADRYADAAGLPPAGIVMIIRHGEKPHGSQRGIDPSGKRDKASLTPAGYARAQRLVDLFAPSGLHAGA